MPVKIITTEDGSHSLFHEELNETYHSTRGARGESMHVFIREGLAAWSQTNSKEEIRVLEVGLGTALNAFLTAQYAASHHQNILYTSLEPFPINEELYRNLNYHNSVDEQQLFLNIHEVEWENKVTISRYFTIQKTTQKLEHFKVLTKYDLIYFDAFAPSKQPGVWSLDNLIRCFNFLNDGGVLTTYCAQGQFKRDLAEAGFKVETLAGAMGKKEMVRATKLK